MNKLINVNSYKNIDVLVNLLFIQIKEEFRRITTIPLERTFMHKLDKYTPKLITLIKAKGGAVGIKMRPLLDSLSQVCLFCLFILKHKSKHMHLCFHLTVHCVC